MRLGWISRCYAAGQAIEVAAPLIIGTSVIATRIGVGSIEGVAGYHILRAASQADAVSRELAEHVVANRGVIQRRIDMALVVVEVVAQDSEVVVRADSSARRIKK